MTSDPAVIAAAADAVPEVSLEGIVKRYPGVVALDGADLSIRPGEVHGLVGENGAGKSTIIKVLGGIVPADAGTIRLHGEQVTRPTPSVISSLGVRFVHQELSLAPDLDVAETVFLGQEATVGPFLSRSQMRRAASDFLESYLGASISPTRLARDLSPAERKLVQIARALVDGQARVVVLDEPTAPLAAPQATQVFEAVHRLRDAGVSVLYVSHYLSEVQTICDRATVLREGRTVAVVEGDDLHSASRLIELMAGRRVDELFPTAPHPPADTPPLLRVEHLGLDGAFDDVSVSVRPGEILGIAGLPGSGRDALTDVLAGLRAPTRGRAALAGRDLPRGSRAASARRGIGLIPRDRRGSGVVLDLSVGDNLVLAALRSVSRAGVVNGREARSTARRTVEALGIRTPSIATPARLLSGGNQQKVVVGRWVAVDAPVLILEEPTVGVDIGAKTEIYRLVSRLATVGTAVIVSSNDTEELAGIAHRVLVLRRGAVVADVDTDEADADRLLALVTGLERPEEAVHG
ncbi:MAG: sugar ABC transporter ATP-binding protein [Actinomyces sp.]|jgi:ribose transport system ATP-binding protein|nr:sugar ABC transporter ATP-binding protein [Actinomyces sp.]MCI1663060.1 sugar ABC transporter ATP-binding protein [Actinomyces sp.]MCI1691698.1 sugar ABC transporter ATP-binding protein [Actinomyces sp.]